MPPKPKPSFKQLPFRSPTANINSSSIKSRLGQIIIGERQIPTPNFIYVTSGGNHIAHLTMDHMNLFEGEMLKFSLDQVIGHQIYKQGELSAVTNGKGWVTMMDIHQSKWRFGNIEDKQLPFRSGNGFVNIKTNTGLMKLNITNYLETIKPLNVELAISPYDSIPVNRLDLLNQNKDDDNKDKTSTSKRHSKSVTRTFNFLKGLIDVGIPENLHLIPVLGGGPHLEIRSKARLDLFNYLNSLSKEHEFPGILISNLDGTIKERVEQLKASIDDNKNKAEDNKKDIEERFIACWEMSSPVEVIEAIKSGVDMFDSSYPNMATEHGIALTFNYNNDNDDIPAYIDLNPSSTFFEDLTPISKHCTCYACQNGYTRSYLTHLLNTKEMLASILLQLHNLHQYQRFFEAIRTAIDEGRLDEFEKGFSNRYGEVNWWTFLS